MLISINPHSQSHAFEILLKYSFLLLRDKRFKEMWKNRTSDRHKLIFNLFHEIIVAHLWSDVLPAPFSWGGNWYFF